MIEISENDELIFEQITDDILEALIEDMAIEMQNDNLQILDSALLNPFI